MGNAIPVLHFDIETFGTADLRKTGMYRYFNDPMTDVWGLCYAIDDGEIQTWTRGDVLPGAFCEHIENGHPVYGHNVAFEHTGMEKILTPKYGFPSLLIDQCYCTAAMAAKMALPRSLDGAAKALKLNVAKDDTGRRLMLQMARPRKPRKDEDPDAILWWDEPDKIKRLMDYCAQDVVVERELTHHLRSL